MRLNKHARKQFLKIFFLYDSLNIYIQKNLEKSRAILFLESNSLKKSLTGNYFSANCSLEKYEFRSDGLFIKVFIDAEVRYPGQKESYYFGKSVDFLFIKENGQLKIADILFYENGMAEIPMLSVTRWDLNSSSKFINIHKFGIVFFFYFHVF